MRPRSWRPIVGLGLAVIVLATAVVVASTYSAPRSAGPLATDSSTSVEFGLANGQVASWGMVLPANPTIADIVIDSIDPVDPTGLEIVGLSVSFPAVDGSIVNAYGYPPPGIATHPITGSVIPPAESATPQVQVMVGVRLLPQATAGSIAGLRIRYHSASGSYETVLPWALKLTRNTP